MTAAAPPGDPSPDETRFRDLFDAHLPDVWAFARRRCASTADADDVAAETFAVAWRRRHDLPAGQERLWLFGVARRVLANQHRGAGRRDALHRRVAASAEPGAAPGPGDDPADGRAARLWAALAALAPEDRELILLRSWDELAVGEIAALLGCTPNAASLRLGRARRRLAAALETTDARGAGQVPGDPRSEEGGLP